MIVFDLECLNAHKFEGWFSSSAEFTRQHERGLVTCPQCGSSQVGKALMAPNIARKGNQLVETPNPRSSEPMTGARSPKPAMPTTIPPQTLAVMQKLATMQAEALKSSRFVGPKFAEDARAMHYGERENEIIHGQATIAEAKELIEEGIAIAPLPFPIVPPEQAN